MIFELTSKNGTVVAVSDSDILGLGAECVGYCLTCGSEQFETESDACHYPCNACGQDQVFGAGEIMSMGLLTVTGDTNGL